MKYLSFIFLFLIAILFSTISFSQEQMKNRLGVGISLDPAMIRNINNYYWTQYGTLDTFFTTVAPIAFYLPINITDKLRVEPSFGIYSVSNNNNIYSNNPNLGNRTNTNDVSTILIGLRGFYVTSFSNSFDLYAGPEIEFNLQASTTSNSYTSNNPNNNISSQTDIKESDITLGLILGAEYFPITHLSIGGEASANYTTFGNPDITYTFTPPANPIYITSTDRSQHSFHTDVLFFVRWYFL